MSPRLAAPLVVLAAILAAAGCGGSSSPAGAPIGAAAKSCETFAADAEALHATNLACDRARQVMYGWQREGSCVLPRGASRGGCLTASYRCQAARTDHGIAVSCARAGESIAFLAKRG